MMAPELPENRLSHQSVLSLLLEGTARKWPSVIQEERTEHDYTGIETMDFQPPEL